MRENIGEETVLRVHTDGGVIDLDVDTFEELLGSGAIVLL